MTVRIQGNPLNSMNTPCFGGLLAAATLAGTPASATILITANLFQSRDYFGTPGNSYYAFVMPSTDEAGIQSLTLANANWSLAGSPTVGVSATWYNWSDLFGALEQNPWTLTVDRGATVEEYTFSLSVLDPVVPAGARVTAPDHGAVNVPLDASFHWSRNDPADAFDSVGVDLRATWFSRATHPGWAPDTPDSWSAPAPMAPGTWHNFVVQYRREAGPDEFSMSAPLDAAGNALPGGFALDVIVNDEASTRFTTTFATAVPEPRAWAALTGLGLAALAAGRMHRRVK